MYENTKNSIDWKGLFLKVIIAFLIVLIALTSYKTFIGGNNKKKNNTTTTQVAESQASTTFTANIAKLKEAGEKYFLQNSDKLPKDINGSTIVTLNELVKNGYIENLSNESNKNCDGESSYVTATKENDQIKLKANLVCGEASSYSIVYMGENDAEIEKEESVETSTSNNKTYTKTNKTSSSSSSKNTNVSNCSNNGCTPNITINTETNVSQNVSINKDTDKKNNNVRTKYYTVVFDNNGGRVYFSKQIVKENNYATNPGNAVKTGYRFVGWYLNNEKFDFNTPITKSITLVAKYVRDNEYKEIDRISTDTRTSLVYTMGWDQKDINSIRVSHTLRLPEELENNDDIIKVKIADINYYQPINTKDLAKIYWNSHRDTFFYKSNGWESDSVSSNSLSTIYERDVDFDYSQRYKDINAAIKEGFDVTWMAYDFDACKRPVEINGVENICNYGIVYEVTWEYEYYNY